MLFRITKKTTLGGNGNLYKMATIKFFKSDLILKAISLVFAIILWFFVVAEQKAEISTSIPIELINLPQDIIVSSELPSQIDIRVYGPRSRLRELSTKNLSYTIDMKTTLPGQSTYHITPDALTIPSGLKITRIHPSELKLNIQRIITKNVNIKPKLIGEIEKGFKIESYSIEPQAIKISGPEDLIHNTKELYTMPININNASNEVIQKVGIDLPQSINTETKNLTLSIKINITPIIETQKITIPIALENKNISYWPKTLICEIEGPVNQLKQIDTKDIAVSIDTKNLPKGTYKLAPKLIVTKRNCIIKNCTPDTINVLIRKNS